jgi:hypothetical protein
LPPASVPLRAESLALPAEPLAEITNSVKVIFDGTEGTAVSAYLEPCMAGIYRIRATVPEMLVTPFPTMVVQSADSSSNEVSAGGASLLDVMPATVTRGADASITLRGINLPAGAAVRVGEEAFAGTLEDGPLQSLLVTLPARLLEAGSELRLTVINPQVAAELPSNAVVLRIR